jgi:hypothetical protein
MKRIRANWSRLVAGLALATVAAVTGRISYTHIYDLTLTLHQPRSTAQLMPFGVDGLIVVGSVVLLQSAPGQRLLGWLGVGPGVAISLFANVESGIRWGILSAAWAGVPALSFALSTFMFERWLKAQVSTMSSPDETVQGSDETVQGSVPESPADELETTAAPEVPGTMSSPDETVPHDVVAAAEIAYRATRAAGNALSQNQLIERFSLTRAQATKVRQAVDAESNGHHHGGDD